MCYSVLLHSLLFSFFPSLFPSLGCLLGRNVTRSRQLLQGSPLAIPVLPLRADRGVREAWGRQGSELGSAQQFSDAFPLHTSRRPGLTLMPKGSA